MDPEEWAEFVRMAQRQFELALEGRRPVFCIQCHRPFRARRGSGQDDEVRDAIYPFRHSCPAPISRAICPGSHQLASLTP